MTYTTTSTFTRTHAYYLTSKVAADLRQMQLFYRKPSNEEIEAYIEELAIFLVNRCLKMVEYGFRRGDSWVIVARYVMNTSGLSSVDDRPGRIPPDANISGASWSSFLEHNDYWWRLNESQRQEIRTSLPFTRTTGTEPRIGSLGWTGNRTYSKNGVSLERSVYRN